MKTVGLIPSAGIASRLFPQTKAMNKLMMPVAGKPVVDYLVQEFIDAGVKEVYITGRDLDQIKKYFSKDSRLESMADDFGHPGSIERLSTSQKSIKINYVTQNSPKGWLSELKKLSDLLGSVNIIMAFSDIIYLSDKPVISQLISNSQKLSSSVSCNGRYLFTSEARDVLKNIKSFKNQKDARNENSFLSKLSGTFGLSHFQAEGEACDVGDWISWMKTNTSFALRNEELGDEYLLFLRDRLNL